MTLLLILAALLIVAAVTAFVMAGRMAVRNRIRHWNGEVISVTESHKRHARVQMLRIASGVCTVLVLIDMVALFTLANYAGTR